MRVPLGIFIVTPLLLSPVLAGAQEQTILLEPLIGEILRDNRELAAFESTAKAAGERSVAAGAMPAPTVGFAVRSLPVPSFSFTEDEMTMAEVFVSQRIPWFGKRELRREAEGKMADVTARTADAAKLDLAEAAVDAYAGLWLSLASREIIDRQAADLQRLATLARSRLASGGEKQADVLRAQMEVARIRVPLLELRQNEARQRATLGALLSRGEPLGGSPELPSSGALPSEAELMASIEAHPELAAFSVEEERAKLDARLASKDKWPDPEVGVAYGFRSGLPDMVSAEVSIPLPIFAGSDQDRRAAAARADARAAASRREARKATLLGEARAAYAAAEALAERLAVYEDEILPRARLTVQSATGAFQSGGVDFLTVLDAQVRRNGEELDAMRTRAELLRAKARLARAAGSLSFLFPMEGRNE